MKLSYWKGGSQPLLKFKNWGDWPHIQKKYIPFRILIEREKKSNSMFIIYGTPKRVANHLLNIIIELDNADILDYSKKV